MGGQIKTVAPARMTAFELLQAQRRRGAYLRDLMRDSERFASLPPQDRALAGRLALGAAGARGFVDEVVASHLSGRRHLEPKVADALALAAYELLFCRTPAAVAASQGVELVRTASPKAAGLANAVLRRIADEDVPRMERALETVQQTPAQATDDDIAWAGGLPVWLCREIASSTGRVRAARLALAQREPAPIYVAANEGMIGIRPFERALADAGLAPQATCLPEAFELGRPQGLAASGLVQKTLAVPSDLSAQIVAHIAAPRPGESLLEIGQGRATKTLLLLGIVRRMGEEEAARGWCAVEKEPFKAKLARRRLAPGWGDAVRCIALDGRNLAGDGLPEELGRLFDTVFLDAPCSGTGTLRRHPEISWTLAPEAVDATHPGSMPALQLELLQAASSRTAPGGRLVYATCSVLAQENEGVVERFLASPAGEAFSLERADVQAGVEAVSGLAGRMDVTESGCFRTCPAPKDPDGHFCAVLRRRTA